LSLDQKFGKRIDNLNELLQAHKVSTNQNGLEFEVGSSSTVELKGNKPISFVQESINGDKLVANNFSTQQQKEKESA